MSKIRVVYVLVHNDYDTYDIMFVTMDYDTACFFRDKWNDQHKHMKLSIEEYILDKDDYNLI